MNENDPYAAWLNQRRAVEPSPEFAQKVLAQIALAPQKQRAPRPVWPWDRWLEWILDWISLRPLLQAALLVIGLVAGMARLAAIFQIILSPW